jgi:hypothetical protein
MEPRRPVGNAGGRARARFGVPVEIRAEFATLEVVDPPREIAWTGTTMRIKAVHVFRFEAMGGGTLARSEESWEGLIASMLKGYSRRTLDKGIRNVLAHLKTEAERRASVA